jgi:DNA-binding NarL/FixJ family response regulator
MEDKILAVLCNVEEPERYFREVFEELLKLPEKERADYIRKLLTALHYRPKLKVVLKRLLEEKKMPLTITEEMIKQDPFFQEGQERERQRIVVSLYRKGKSPEEIAELLDLSIEEVKSLLNKKQ